MQDLKILLVQADQIWEDKQSNFDNYTQLLQGVEAVDLIILPEMFHTGFSMNPRLLAEKMEISIGMNWLKKVAREKNAAIYTSLIIEENNRFFNRGVFVYPSGEMKQYDKRKCFGLGGEDKLFTAGKKKTVVLFKGWHINLQICYDLRFPEISRNKLNAEKAPCYDATIFVANWPEKRSFHWKTLLTARAIENQCYAIGVNRVGVDGQGLTYSGDSLVSDALGNIDQMEAHKQNSKIVSLSAQKLKEIRVKLPFLKD
jgi:omega-amidase